MAEMMWFDRKAGSVVSINEEECALLIMEGIPDVVRLPPNLGGRVVKVLHAFRAKCPVHGYICRHLALEEGFYVAESDQFYWYRLKGT